MISVVLSGLLLAGAAVPQCDAPSQSKIQLHWSRYNKVVAPNRSFAVEVHPILDSEENQSPVTLRACETSKSWPLFILQRSAELYWSADSKRLLIVDEPLSGTNKVMLFPIDKLTQQSQANAPDAINVAIKEALTRKLGKHSHFQFYLPTYVSWNGNDLLLAIGGTTYTQENGPEQSYCYGFEIDSSSMHIKKIMPDGELGKTGGSCRTAP